MAHIPTQQPASSQAPAPKHNKRKKLAKLPANARVEKRPLLRPAIPSPYSGTQEQKVVYISTKTPFLSAVKRVEKLIHLVDKRQVQSATTLSKQNRNKPGGGAKRKRGRDGDELLDIAEEAEKLKRRRQEGANGDGNGDRGEEVVLKGTGKAISKVMELGLWFQQREEYVVRLRTGSVGAIDDVTTEVEIAREGDPEQQEGVEDDRADAEVGAENTRVAGSAMGVNASKVASNEASGQTSAKKQEASPTVASGGQETKEVTETRVRYTSVLEVAMTLR